MFIQSFAYPSSLSLSLSLYLSISLSLSLSPHVFSAEKLASRSNFAQQLGELRTALAEETARAASLADKLQSSERAYAAALGSSKKAHLQRQVMQKEIDRLLAENDALQRTRAAVLRPLTPRPDWAELYYEFSDLDVAASLAPPETTTAALSHREDDEEGEEEEGDDDGDGDSGAKEEDGEGDDGHNSGDSVRNRNGGRGHAYCHGDHDADAEGDDTWRGGGVATSQSSRSRKRAMKHSSSSSSMVSTSSKVPTVTHVRSLLKHVRAQQQQTKALSRELVHAIGVHSAMRATAAATSAATTAAAAGAAAGPGALLTKVHPQLTLAPISSSTSGPNSLSSSSSSSFSSSSTSTSLSSSLSTPSLTSPAQPVSARGSGTLTETAPSMPSLQASTTASASTTSSPTTSTSGLLSGATSTAAGTAPPSTTLVVSEGAASAGASGALVPLGTGTNIQGVGTAAGPTLCYAALTIPIYVAPTLSSSSSSSSSSIALLHDHVIQSLADVGLYLPFPRSVRKEIVVRLPGPGRSFQGLCQGTRLSSEVPEFLRIAGKVRNRGMGRKECESTVQAVWREKMVSDARAGWLAMNLADYFGFHLRHEVGVPAIVAEWGYNVLEAVFRHSNSPECSTFYKVLTGHLPEEAYYDQAAMLSCVTLVFSALDALRSVIQASPQGTAAVESSSASSSMLSSSSSFSSSSSLPSLSESSAEPQLSVSDPSSPTTSSTSTSSSSSSSSSSSMPVLPISPALASPLSTENVLLLDANGNISRPLLAFALQSLFPQRPRHLIDGLLAALDGTVETNPEAAGDLSVLFKETRNGGESLFVSELKAQHTVECEMFLPSVKDYVIAHLNQSSAAAAAAAAAALATSSQSQSTTGTHNRSKSTVGLLSTSSPALTLHQAPSAASVSASDVGGSTNPEHDPALVTPSSSATSSPVPSLSQSVATPTAAALSGSSSSSLSSSSASQGVPLPTATSDSPSTSTSLPDSARHVDLHTIRVRWMEVDPLVSVHTITDYMARAMGCSPEAVDGDRVVDVDYLFAALANSSFVRKTLNYDVSVVDRFAVLARRAAAMPVSIPLTLTNLWGSSPISSYNINASHSSSSSTAGDSSISFASASVPLEATSLFGFTTSALIRPSSSSRSPTSIHVGNATSTNSNSNGGNGGSKPGHAFSAILSLGAWGDASSPSIADSSTANVNAPSAVGAGVAVSGDADGSSSLQPNVAGINSGSGSVVGGTERRVHPTKLSSIVTRSRAKFGLAKDPKFDLAPVQNAMRARGPEYEVPVLIKVIPPTSAAGSASGAGAGVGAGAASLDVTPMLSARSGPSGAGEESPMKSFTLKSVADVPEEATLAT